MSSGEPLVSVVTPFYNTDLYLAECIESVLAQTHRHFEYILVDNHSTDRSGAIADEYARRDSRIRLIRADQFRPQIPNYKFAQADDWLYPRCLTEMVELADANPNVAIVSSYDLRGQEVYGSGLRPEQRVLSGRDAGQLYFLKWLFLYGSPTTVMYRSDVVRARTPFFPEGTLHADTEVVFQILAERDFGFVHQVLCFIRTQEDSITGKTRDLSDTALDRLIIVKKYGRLFLSAAEFDECLHLTQRWYDDELGRRWLAERMGKPSGDFWDFHRRGLATIGETIERNRLVRAAARILADKLLNPGHLVRKAREVGMSSRSGTRDGRS
jgi:glycosyltransferase involved in cell wall biosynthesis